MLPDAIRALIEDEQRRQHGRLIEGTELNHYLEKLGERAEILSDSVAGQCRGFVAFYGNDESTKQAYITMVLVAPEYRGLGIGTALVSCVLELARRRGFTTCRLEVAESNADAFAIYSALGFRHVEQRGGRQLLEVRL
jgi:ribosomal protein S18 acetylase RimI-like enzyme